MGDELLAQLVEQLGVADWALVGRLVIDRVDNPDAEEMGPNAIRPRAREVYAAARAH